ncbi:ABC transporter permease [uncultured Parabacteroides sp.]|jgi:putative ABC transport system permease protein|uniref:ABC transporter permease n=1 Tax=uncultured Parabacteroides sp. TaxID=512312 RepID=UPI0025E53385|nr:ABC transporter permease [uncultured Parabacteroides sp.]
MLKHYIKVAIRSIKRSLLFSSINMLGFVLGMTAAFLIYLWIVDEMTFEDFQVNRDSIYRVIVVEQEASGQTRESAYTVAPLSKVLREEFPQVENATFMLNFGTLNLHSGTDLIEAKYTYVDTAFFDVFSFPVVAGVPDLIKKDPQQIVLSESAAKKLFGEASAVGKEVSCRFFGRIFRYKVAAVLKVPRKSHIKFEVLLSEQAYYEPVSWDFVEGTSVYIQLRKGSVLSDADRQKMSRVWLSHKDKGMPLVFQPLKDIHLHTLFKDPEVSNHGNMSQIYLFAALAVLIVFMGAFNFTTLSTARASQRFREIGVRKVTGAKRKVLVMQFLSESLVQAFLALILALALTELLLPLFNQFVEKDIALTVSWQTVLFVLVGIVGVGCLAGAFPAFYMSRFNPLQSFRGGRSTGKKGTLVKGLVCVQFVIAIAMVFCTSVVFEQLNYLQNADLGLDKEDMVVADCGLFDFMSYMGGYGIDDYKQEVLKNPNVRSVTGGVELSDYLRGHQTEENSFSWMNGSGQVDSLKMVGVAGDGDFMETLGLTVLKGKTFGADKRAYMDGAYEKELPIVINETAWKMMNVEDPVGMLLQNKGWYGETSRIVGVVKDFNFQPLREKVKPAYLYYSRRLLNTLYIKISPENKAETLKFLKEEYEKMRPDNVFTYRFFSDALNLNYAHERQLGRMFLIFTVLAIIVAMMGVFGLVALSTVQRTKEIGVRKVNGAHTRRIVWMFCREYMVWVGIAFLIACPLSYLLMLRWLSNFAYQVTISWWLFPLAGCVILSITMLTVIVQTWRAASRNPVTSLRYE